MRYQQFQLSRSQQLYSTPEKRPLSNWKLQGSFGSSTSPTMIPQLEMEYLQAKNLELSSRMQFLECSLVKERSKKDSIRLHSRGQSCRCGDRYQSQVRVLENYLKSNHSINKETILYIFGREPEINSKVSSTISQQCITIRELNDEMKLLAEENSRLRYGHDSSINQQLDQLRQENKNYQTQLSQYQRTEEDIKAKLLNENRFLRHRNDKQEAEILRLNSDLSETDRKGQNTPFDINSLKCSFSTELKAFYESLELRTQCLNQCLDQFNRRIAKAEGQIENIDQSSSRKIETMRKNGSDLRLAVKTQENSYDSGDTVKERDQILLDYSEETDNHSLSKGQALDFGQKMMKLETNNKNLTIQNEELTISLKEKSDYLNAKIEKILTLENQLNILKNKGREESRSKPHKNYAIQVQNIRQTLLSCNPTNFQMFQTEFKEIIQQRNTLNQKMRNFKKTLDSGRDSSRGNKENSLDRQLKQERRKVKALEENVKQLTRLNMNFQEMLDCAQQEIEDMKNSSFGFSQQVADTFSHLSKGHDGNGGLEWQLVVEKCILEAAERLRILLEEMDSRK